jgi:hypothetical protein
VGARGRRGAGARRRRRHQRGSSQHSSAGAFTKAHHQILQALAAAAACQQQPCCCHVLAAHETARCAARGGRRCLWAPQSAPGLARAPCQHRCGTDLAQVLQQTWVMEAARHQAKPLCRRSLPSPAATGGGGVQVLGRPGPEGLAHAEAAHAAPAVLLGQGAAPQQRSSPSRLGLSPPMSASQPWPSSARAASARERRGRAAGAGTCCVALRAWRARGGAPSGSSQTLAWMHASGPSPAPPIAARRVSQTAQVVDAV